MTLERKDFIALSISIMALALSLITFVDAKLTKSNEVMFEESQNTYSAFRLGEKFGVAVVAYTQTNQGTKSEIDTFKNKTINFLKDPQAYADILGLRIDLADILKNYDPNSSFNRKISQVVSERINAVHTKKISSVFRITYWAYWLRFNTLISKDKDTGSWLVGEFNKILFPILSSEMKNLNLSEIEIKEAENLNDLLALSKNLQNLLKARYVKK